MMEKKTIDLGSAAQEAGKNAKSLWNKTKNILVNAVDQNSDGTFDMEDVSAIVETIGTAAKKTATTMKASAEERSRELERKQLQPIFAEDLDSAEFLISKLVRITELDKRHAESEVCQGSIGYTSVQKDLRIVNIFKNSINEFGLSFYPDHDCELYYVDPSDRDKYIALDDYFSFL